MLLNLYLVQFCNKYLWLYLFACYVFYIVQKWVYESIHLYEILSIFYKCMQTIKLRQTTENNGGPCILKNDAKGVPWASKSNGK